MQLSATQQEKCKHGSNSKYTYLNHNNQAFLDHPKLKHFYHYQNIKISSKQPSLNSTLNLNYNYSTNNQNTQKTTNQAIKNQLFDSRLSFQRFLPSQKYTRKSYQKSTNFIGQFSPFQDNQLMQKLLIQELQVQYHLVKNQLKEYQYQNEHLRQKVKNFQNQCQLNSKILQQKNQQLVQVKRQHLIRVQKYQILIDQLKKQIQLTTLKNFSFQAQIQAYKSQILNFKNQLNYNKFIQENEKQWCSIQKRQPGVLYIRRENNDPFRRKRSMPGKLLNKTFTNIGNAKQENQQYANSRQDQVIFDQKIFLKYEHLIQSIRSMYKKIQNASQNDLKGCCSNQRIDLKNLWKWLKKLGHCYSSYQSQKNAN